MPNYDSMQKMTFLVSKSKKMKPSIRESKWSCYKKIKITEAIAAQCLNYLGDNNVWR